MIKASVFKPWAVPALVAVLAQVPAAFAAPRFPIEVSRATLSADGTELELAFLDRESVRNACNYHVARFEYVRAAELLVVELASQSPCPLDRVGRRSGSFKWVLPAALRGTGRVGVVLNQLKVGEIAFEGARAEFFPILFD
ncbi:MAG TPA: hypothetical protein VM598_06045 [Bdellovibrionota bacterium]|nr:hypothetical protein [Bdellovibrionota bacterium]